MEKDLLKRIAITRLKPDETTDLEPNELAELVLIVLDYTKEIKKQIEEGRIKGSDGYTPKAGIDYLAKEESIALLDRAVQKLQSEATSIMATVRNGKDGKDAEITQEDLDKVAKLAVELIELPDFRKYITEQPEAIRDSLELLQGEDRLDASAIKGLDELLKKYEGKKEIAVGGIRFLSQLVDVYTTSLANNDVLKWNSTTLRWENGAVAGGSGALDDITDVTITAVADNEVLAYDNGSSTWINQTAAEAGLAPALGADDNYVTDAEKTKLSNLSGTNTGDQTSIVGITGTKAQFDTAVTDGNFLYVGDITQYTDELAQDAVGGMVNSTLSYTDVTPLLELNLASANTWLADQSVPDEAYGVGWNGSMEVPTKNALYDKIETLGGGSGITRTVVTTSGSITLGATASVDYTYYVAGAHTLSMPSPNTNRYTIKNLHSAAITVDTAGAENIEGAASLSLQPNDSIEVMSDGTNWYIH